MPASPTHSGGSERQSAGIYSHVEPILHHKGLVTNYREGGGATKWEGGHPYEKGCGKSFSHAEGGAQ